LQRKFPTLTDIDDLVQESYARLIQARSVGIVREPRAYLFTTARNAAHDLFRRGRSISLETLEENGSAAVAEDRPDAAETASNVQEIEILTEGIRALPARCREILTLRKLHGLSYREIAERLGITESTVNAQLAIGMVRCRQHLTARGVLRKGGHVIEPS
jgi:RNA polymerase sigma-70 factor (ECF subfamily)